MKALTYQSSRNVSVQTVPDTVLKHLSRQIPDMEFGDVLGHAFMGIVEDTGKGVTRLKKGDRVVVPFTVACGECFFCNKALFAACETTNPGRGAILNKKNMRSGAGLFGYSHLYGGYSGGQAEYVRVPKAKAEEECRKVVLTPSGPRPLAPTAPIALEADRTPPL
jgi:threonine dehydrogenase-like Zn-dependent dehydrogenase